MASNVSRDKCKVAVRHPSDSTTSHVTPSHCCIPLLGLVPMAALAWSLLAWASQMPQYFIQMATNSKAKYKPLPGVKYIEFTSDSCIMLRAMNSRAWTRIREATFKFTGRAKVKRSSFKFIIQVSTKIHNMKYNKQVTSPSPLWIWDSSLRAFHIAWARQRM